MHSHQPHQMMSVTKSFAGLFGLLSVADGLMAGGDWSYRAQWWVRHTPGREAFTAMGINGQWIYVDVDRNVAIVKQSSQPVSSDDWCDGYNLVLAPR